MQRERAEQRHVPQCARDHEHAGDRDPAHRADEIAPRVVVRARAEKRGWPVSHLRPPRSEEHTSELQSLMRISYAVFCLKKKKIVKKYAYKNTIHNTQTQTSSV